MAVAGIVFDGFDELRRDLRRIADKDLQDEMVAANKELAADVVAQALPNVPVRTGRLRQSVRGLGNKSGAVGKAGGAAVPYAAAIHWGRRQGGVIAARPFLWAAGKQIEASVEERYRARVEAVLKAVNAAS